MSEGGLAHEEGIPEGIALGVKFGVFPCWALDSKNAGGERMEGGKELGGVAEAVKEPEEG